MNVPANVLPQTSVLRRYRRFIFVSAILSAITLLTLYAAELTSFAIRLLWEENLLIRRDIATAIQDKVKLLDAYESYGYRVDRRSAREVLDAEVEVGRRVVPFILPAFVFNAARQKLFPLGGIANQDVLLENENGFWPIVHHDSHGFNNDQDAWQSPTFVIMGQSTIYGSGVNRPQHFVQQLRTRYGFKILNLGYPQIPTPEAYLALIREYGSIISPRYLIWEILDRSIGRDHEHDSLRESVFRQYDDPNFSQGLLGRQDEINAYTREAASRPIATRPIQYTLSSTGSVIEDILLLRNLRNQSDIFHTLLSPIIAKPITYTTKPQRSDTPSHKCNSKLVTREMKFLFRAAREIGPKTEIIVLMMPSRERVRGDYDPNDFCHMSYLTAAADAGFPTIDLPTLIEKRSIPVERIYEMAIPSTIHFSVAGHTLIADILASELKRFSNSRTN